MIPGTLGIREIFAFALICLAFSGVHTVVIEWGLVSAQQLMQQNKGYDVGGNGNSIDIDVPKGSEIQIVPGRYGLFNRPREININLSEPKRKHSSSEKHHGHSKRQNSSEPRSSEEHREHSGGRESPEERGGSPEHDGEHHKSSSEELNEDHYEQARHDAELAETLHKGAEAERASALEHEKLAAEEREAGNTKAAEREEELAEAQNMQADMLYKLAEAQELEAVEELDMAGNQDDISGDHKHHPDNHHKHDDDKHHGHDDGEHHGHDDEEHGHHNDGNHHGHDDGKHNNDHDGKHDKSENHDDDKHHKGEQDKSEDEEPEEGPSGVSGEDYHQVDESPEGASHHKIDRRSPIFSPFSSSDSVDPPPKPTTDTSGASVSVDTSVSTPSNDVQTTTAATVEDTGNSTDTATNSETQTTTNVNTDTSSVTSDTTTTTSTSSSSSSWFSWFGASEEPPKYSPYTLLKFLSPTDTSPEALASMFSVFSDPTNNSYLSNASTVMRVVLFFMPGTGIVDQVYFTMAVSKIMWEAATMYYDGYGTVPIALTVLSDLAYESTLARRDDSIIQKTILIPGECVDVSSMDVPTFLKYIRNIEYPALTPEQEQKIRDDINNIVSITYPTISDDLKTSFVDGLKDSVKFLSLINVQGDLIVENVDVNFSDAYISMHSAFDKDTLLDKLEKMIQPVIDTLKQLPDLVIDP